MKINLFKIILGIALTIVLVLTFSACDTEEPVDTPPVEHTLIYENEELRVSYVKQEQFDFGLAIKLLIENKTVQPLNIAFIDVHIDDYLVSSCGAQISSLLEGEKMFESINLYYEDFSEFPSTMDFIVTIIDSAGGQLISKSEPIIIDLVKY